MQWDAWGYPGQYQEILKSFGTPVDIVSEAAAVKRMFGKGTVTYIGVDTDDSKLEKDLLGEIFNQAGAITEDYPPGIYVNWRDGFYVEVNYSSENCTLNVPANVTILIGDRVPGPAGVAVWNE